MLREVHKRNIENQPSLKQLKLREEETNTQPMGLIKKIGKTGSAVRQFFYTDLDAMSHILQAKSKLMQFKIRPFLSETPKYDSSECGQEDCLRCRYTTINNYNGYKLLHFSQMDTVMVLGSIHSRMLIGFVVPKDILQGMYAISIHSFYGLSFPPSIFIRFLRTNVENCLIAGQMIWFELIIHCYCKMGF